LANLKSSLPPPFFFSPLLAGLTRSREQALSFFLLRMNKILSFFFFTPNLSRKEGCKSSQVFLIVGLGEPFSLSLFFSLFHTSRKFFSQEQRHERRFFLSFFILKGGLGPFLFLFPFSLFLDRPFFAEKQHLLPTYKDSCFFSPFSLRLYPLFFTSRGGDCALSLRSAE